MAVDQRCIGIPPQDTKVYDDVAVVGSVTGV